MRELNIQTDENLVLNGDFTEWPDHWKKNLGRGWLSTQDEIYDDEFTRFLAAGNEASVSQDIIIPKDPGTDAHYVLSFLCETRHIEAGWVQISVEGSQDVQTIRLEPGNARDREDDQARLASGQPLALSPRVYEEKLELPIKSGDVITLSIFSPKNEPSDYLSQICIFRIRLDLRLGPLALQAVWLDDQPSPLGRTLHLCVDGTHTLKFEPEDDNAWLGTHVALVSENNPDGAVLATPEWGVNQSLDREWQITCPWLDLAEPHLLTLILHNRYSAEPYPISVSLGHHRLVFREVLEAAYYPVLEFSQGVRLGVQVTSFYTSLPVTGRPVTWTLAGQPMLGVTQTNDEGWAYFDFQPTQAGDVEIEASVESLYYPSGVFTQTFVVRVLATDPWRDLSAVVDGVATRWEEKTGYPNRGAVYSVVVKLPETSPLLGTHLAMHWSGDSPEQLGVVVYPALGYWLPIPSNGVELPWTLTSEDRLDGQFWLSLVCSKLLLPSPKKPMSLARNVVRIGDVREANKLPEVDENESVLLRVQVVHDLNGGAGEPVIGALVDWVAQRKDSGSVEARSSTRSGAGGWAGFLFAPSQAIQYVVTASVRAHLEAVAVEWPFDVVAAAANPWKSEVKILLDGEEVDRVELGLHCRRGQTHTLKVEPIAGSGWVDANISLHWRGAAPDIGLVPTDLGVSKVLVAGGVEWKLVSEANASISSLFDLELHLEGERIVRELFGRLIAADPKEELSLLLDQVQAVLDGQALYPCLGAQHRFNVLPNALTPLVGLKASLTWSGTPADQLEATIDPALNVPQLISDGGTPWELDFTRSGDRGEFALTLALPQLEFVATVTPMKLAHNKVRIETWRESAVDPVVGQEPAWNWVQVCSHFTGQAVGEVPVKWMGSSVVPSDADGWSGFAFSPENADQAYQVTAEVESLYDGFKEQRDTTVRALATDPWEGLEVSFDQKEFKRWSQHTCFPRRKGTHSIDLRAAANSPLSGRHLILGMTGAGPEALGINFQSAGLGVPRLFHGDMGLNYQFKVADLRDASFALRLSSERLASLSPANPMSLGEGSQVLKISSNSSAFQTLDWGQALVGQVTVVSVISGKPMVGWVVTWRSPDLGVVNAETDYYGVARVRFVPTTPGEAGLTATVGGKDYSESVELSYVLNEPRKIQTLCSPKPNGHLGELVSAVANVVSAQTGEPLQDVEVRWDYPDRTIAPTRTDAEGNAWVEFRMPGVRKGLLQAVVTGGFGGWEAKFIEFELVPNMSTSTSTSTSTSSSTWLQEFRPYVNDVEVDWLDVKLNLVSGEVCTLKLDYKYSWLIGAPEGFLTLEYASDVEEQGLVFDPPLEQRCEMAKGTTSLSWSIFTEIAHSGPFVLNFSLPEFEQLPNSPPLPGEVVNFAQEVDVKFDEFSVDFGASAYPCHGARHTVNVRPKPSSQFLNKPINLVWGGEPAANLGVVVAPSLGREQLLTSEGVTWELNCLDTTRNGDFFLQLMLVESGLRSSPLAMSLGHNHVTVERWSTAEYQWPDIEWQKYHIRATSVFLKKGVPGVRVTRATNQFFYFTDSKGEAATTISTQAGGRLEVHNKYDGTVI
ncbi:MAG: hypothetical protein Q7U27_10640 [Pseudomonas sp.]|uniref:hypothetical protein n=1 Tax=Pseudomonas sp. TaxID=306 RepID=UPI002717277D|nr:hypothetical protein [Pseudomonas sp.]MDO9329178.1 hypothetical protein [Pseudomonas sp.]